MNGWRENFAKLTADQVNALEAKHGIDEILISQVWQGASSLEERWMDLEAIIGFAIRLQMETEETLR